LESPSSQVEPVRCVHCHAVYEKAAEPLADAASETCPVCGGAAWIAAEIPLPESASPATA
jgi:rRNA maturation endonuclease Nob1